MAHGGFRCELSSELWLPFIFPLQRILKKNNQMGVVAKDSNVIMRQGDKMHDDDSNQCTKTAVVYAAGPVRIIGFCSLRRGLLGEVWAKKPYCHRGTLRCRSRCGRLPGRGVFRITEPKNKRPLSKVGLE